ncbi:hypothetical protein RIF29_41172 [Crotalaria pallida]|uniref:Uncharacterized protein n=1 Tax=Crotalaria pallida TaxID=3830 RepID=A0AAN9E7I3_CROPI
MSKLSAYYYRSSSNCIESSSSKGCGLDLKKKIHYDSPLPKKLEFGIMEEVEDDFCGPKKVEFSENKPLPKLPKKVEFSEIKPLPKLPKKVEFGEVKRVEGYCDDVDDECNSSANKNKGKEVYNPPIEIIAPSRPAPKNGYASSTVSMNMIRSSGIAEGDQNGSIIYQNGSVVYHYHNCKFVCESMDITIMIITELLPLTTSDPILPRLIL